MGCFENQSDLPASPVSTISRDSWQQTRHHWGGEHHPHYRLPYAEARNNVPGTGRQLLRQTQPPANYPTTGKTSAGSRPHSDSRANTVSIPVERLTEGIFKGGQKSHPAHSFQERHHCRQFYPIRCSTFGVTKAIEALIKRF